MKTNKPYLTRNNDQYATPSNIYNYFINVCKMQDFNPLKEDYEDSLIKEFNSDLYCNPPYSNIEPFVDYMIKHYKKGYNVIMLLPSRTGTKWFKKLIKENCHIYFFTQRLKFNDYKCAPFDTMIISLNKNHTKTKINFINRNLEIEK